MSNKLRSMKRGLKEDVLIICDQEIEMDDLKEKLAKTLCGCGKTKMAMFYECEKCGRTVPVWLERGLEEHNGNAHKPVPFTIGCKVCRGLMRHVDWKNDINLLMTREIPNESYYFANIDGEKCGRLKYKN